MTVRSHYWCYYSYPTTTYLQLPHKSYPTGATHGARTLLKSHQKLVTDLKLVLAGIKECAGKCRKEQCDSLNVELWVSKTPELIADLINIRFFTLFISSFRCFHTF